MAPINQLINQNRHKKMKFIIRYIIVSIVSFCILVLLLVLQCNQRDTSKDTSIDNMPIGEWTERAVRIEGHPAKITFYADNTFVFENFPNDLNLAAQPDNEMFLIWGMFQIPFARTCKNGTDEEKWPTVEGTWKFMPTKDFPGDAHVKFTVTSSSYEGHDLPDYYWAYYTHIRGVPEMDFRCYAWKDIDEYGIVFNRTKR